MTSKTNPCWIVVHALAVAALWTATGCTGKKLGAAGSCADDDDCGANMVCENRRCVAACRGDGECRPDYFCRAGHCVAGCRAADDCAGELICQRGRCVPPLFAVADAGSAMVSIAVPDAPSRLEIYAAAELEAYLEAVSGAQFEVVREAELSGPGLLLGNTQWARFRRCCDPATTPLGQEGFCIGFEGDHLLIYGGSARGVLYGVYALLEQIGVKWLVAGELGTVVPERPTLMLEREEMSERPHFRYRSLGPGGRWALRNRANRLPADLRDETGDAGFTLYPGPYHTMIRWLNPAVYCDDHRDWYGQGYCERDFKVDTSLAAVWEEITANMIAYLEANPETDMIALSPMDHGHFAASAGTDLQDATPCGAPDCEHSRRYLLFYKEVCARVAEVFPDMQILVGAYASYTLPPADYLSIGGAPNMSVILAHYDHYDHARPIQDHASSGNQRFREIIDRWDALLDGRIYFYEYYWKVNWFDLPWPIVHSIGADLAWMHQRGFRGIHTQASPETNGWMHGLNYYVAAKMMWDADQDPEALVNHWIEGLFEEAAAPMKTFYGELEAAMAAQTDIAGYAEKNAHRVLTPTVLSTMRQAYEEAVLLAAGNPLVSARLEKIAVVLEYSERMMSVIGDLRADRWLRAAEALTDLIAEIDSAPRFDGVISPQVLGLDSGYYLSALLETCWQNVVATMGGMAKPLVGVPVGDATVFYGKISNTMLEDATEFPSEAGYHYVEAVNGVALDFTWQGSGDLVLTADFFDVDEATEIALQVDGVFIGHVPDLGTAYDAQWVGPFSFVIPAAVLEATPDHTLHIDNTANPPNEHTWGVRNIRLEIPDSNETGLYDDEERVFANGTPLRYRQGLRYRFDWRGDLVLQLDPFDVDDPQDLAGDVSEVGVLFNNRFIGYLSGCDSRWRSDPDCFAQPQRIHLPESAVVQDGVNELILFNRYNNLAPLGTYEYAWGVRDVRITYAELEPEVPDHTVYGNIPPDERPTDAAYVTALYGKHFIFYWNGTAPLRLTADFYDIDWGSAGDAEVKIRINAQAADPGHVDTVIQDGWTGTQTFEISPTLLQADRANLLTIDNDYNSPDDDRHNTYKWGVRDIILEPAP